MKAGRMPTIKSVMTPFPYSIDIDASLAAAHSMMERHRIHHLPVADKGKLVGVISRQDIESCLARLPDNEPGAPRVRSCYAPRVFTVGLAAPLDSVLLQMAERHAGLVLVVKGDKLAGIFTETDAFQGFAELLRRQYPPSPAGKNNDNDAA